MKELKSTVGLDVVLGDDNKLTLGQSLTGGEFSKRSLSDIKEVLADQNLKIDNRDLYYMFRDIRQPEDEALIRNAKVRFDMTVILPGILGREYTKTLGHYHPDKAGLSISYPEVYEVVSGRAFYLIQKPKRMGTGFDYSIIDEAYLVEVRAGEKAIMPPDFGHITINIDSEPLVMSNWVCSEFSSDYSEIKKYKGGAAFVKEGNPFEISMNSSYSIVPEVKVVRPKPQPEFALPFNQPMYLAGINDPARLEYLESPEIFKELLIPEKLFTI